jgi:hypothetical protein
MKYFHIGKNKLKILKEDYFQGYVYNWQWFLEVSAEPCLRFLGKILALIIRKETIL